MALPTTSLSFSALQTEFGGSNPISLSEYYRGGTNVPSGTTSSYGTIPTSGAINLGVFRGTQKANPILINDHELVASVGSVFNGDCNCAMIFQGTGIDRGKLFYDIFVGTGADPGRFVRFSTNGAVTAFGETGISGEVVGSWLPDEPNTLPSAYEIYVSPGSGFNGLYCQIAGASFNTWTNMATNITLNVSATRNDAIDQYFYVQIRRASDQQVLDTATYTMNALAAGIN